MNWVPSAALEPSVSLAAGPKSLATAAFTWAGVMPKVALRKPLTSSVAPAAAEAAGAGAGFAAEGAGAAGAGFVLAAGAGFLPKNGSADAGPATARLALARIAPRTI